MRDIDSPTDLLEVVYQKLGFREGQLMAAAGRPDDDSRMAWMDKGEWLSVADAVGAEKIFFVGNDPVVVFVRHTNSDEGELRRIFNRIWCMARPQLLFLAYPGELAVLDLSRPPMRVDEHLSEGDRILDIVRTAAEVQARLLAYRREQIESGRLFEDARFEGGPHRASEALVRDLRVVRRKLIEIGLGVSHAHALIGRSIFVRYLEDRGIITRKYFEAVASGNSQWLSILEIGSDVVHSASDSGELMYPKVLGDKQFTYALFQQLAADFNGDMFPTTDSEMDAVTSEHLRWMQSFLRGDTTPQMRLFFFAYAFDVIPIELISSIYEEFYNVEEGKTKNQGSHYTPGSLVEYLLAHALTRERLDETPRVIDPACGSGIFLVEAFRRIVRYRTQRSRRRLSRKQLARILRDQIAGIDINPEAIRVTAFSLYLAMLHYLDPPDINQHRRLPNLVYAPREDPDPDQHFDVLMCANAFTLDGENVEPYVRRRFGSRCADIVVGNPPWGFPKKDDLLGMAAATSAIEWCNRQVPPREIGDKELSQAFVHRAIDLLSDGGAAGLLVSTGLFFKNLHHNADFRNQWLSTVILYDVVNFAHVRDVFFQRAASESDAIAPFAAVVFAKANGTSNEANVHYWTAKKTSLIKRLKSVILTRSDLKIVQQSELRADDTLWKVYWWGNHRDASLVSSLRLQPLLRSIRTKSGPLFTATGCGFEVGSRTRPAGPLTGFREYPTRLMERYGLLPRTAFVQVPEKVHRLGDLNVYDGDRILVKRGISQEGGSNGIVVARLESEPFCFRHSVYGFRLAPDGVEIGQQVLGILWSSLARYFFFMTSGSWGMWHHEISDRAIQNLPVVLPTDASLRHQLLEVVEALRAYHPPTSVSKQRGNKARSIVDLEQRLDEVVFDIYRLRDPERDLVRDMCTVGLDLFYRHIGSEAVKPVLPGAVNLTHGTHRDLPRLQQDRGHLAEYVRVLLDIWNHRLEPNGEFQWRIVGNGETSMVAVILSSQLKDSPLNLPEKFDEKEWVEVLGSIANVSVQPHLTSNVYTDGLLRMVTDTNVLVVKRNEVRHWTASAAREDAEATLLQAMLRDQGAAAAV